MGREEAPAAGPRLQQSLEQTRQTFNFGFGSRVFLKDKWSVQVDLRDHIFSIDLLGKRQSTQNLELTAGVSYFF